MCEVQDSVVEWFKSAIGHNVSKNTGCDIKGINSGNQSGQRNLFHVQINSEKAIVVICAMCYTEIAST